MEETRPTTLHFSGISDLRSCPERYYANQVLRIEPKVVSDALKDGKLFHHALETAARETDREAQRLAAFGQVKADLKAGRCQPINAARVRAMLTGYFRKWGGMTWQTWAREYPVSGPIPGIEGLTYEGTIDRVIQVQGGFAVVDYKTAGKVDDSYLEALARRLQGPLYAWYLEQDQGVEVVEIIYDLVVKPSGNFKPSKIKSGPRKGERETMAEFEDRMQAVYQEHLDEMLFRPALDLTREHREEALRILADTAREVLWRLDTGNWCENRDACEGGIKSWPCPYRQACYSRFNPVVIEQHYRKKTVDTGEEEV